MRSSREGGACRCFLQCLLKFLNLLLGLVGASLILFSLWNLYHLTHNGPARPPTSSSFAPILEHELARKLVFDSDDNGGGIAFFSSASQGVRFHAWDLKLPPFWFVYFMLGTGITISLITCCGHIAAETVNRCCLSCYLLFIALLILLQAGLSADIFFNKNWEEELPDDTTGLFNQIQHFLKQNWHVARWIALGMLIIEALSVILALCLRASIPTKRKAYDSDDEGDDDYEELFSRSASSHPPPSNWQASGEARAPRPDAWSDKIREKYAIDNKGNNLEAVESNPSSQESTSRCTIT